MILYVKLNIIFLHKIVWDDDKQTWVDQNATEEEQAKQNTLPPTDTELSCEYVIWGVRESGRRVIGKVKEGELDERW